MVEGDRKRLLLRVLHVVLGAGVVAQMGVLTLHGLAAGGHASSKRALAAGGSAADPLREILAGKMFGEEPVRAGPDSMPRVSLVLVGTLAFDSPDQGFALLGERAESASLVRAGASLPGGGTLARVYPDHVLLDRGGITEILHLVLFGGSVVAASSTSSGRAGPESLAANQDPGHGDPARRARVPPVELLHSADPVVRGVAMLQATTVSAPDGSVRGVEIRPMVALRSQTALRPMDVVVGINGAPLSGADPAAQLAEEMTRPQRIRLAVQHQGTDLPVDVEIDTRLVSGLVREP